ncbi:ABC transporter ATP-binding protein [soil metagenome]
MVGTLSAMRSQAPPSKHRAAAAAPGASAAIEVTDIDKRFGDNPVLRSVSLRVAAGSVVALLGPSGCGKTTLLRTIAGLEAPDAGEVAVGGRILTSARGSVPPEGRRIGMVFQDWALFPHLTVARNVGYGLERRQRGGERVEAALVMVGLGGMGDRLPGTLSGGQQQRVALARALAPEPAAILLDEPFSNLDTSLRVQVRGEVHRLLAGLGITTVFVTHDQEEAFVLGDEVAVMHDGRIVQHATPAELYAHPATPWVATFVGEANLVAGDARGAEATTPVGRVPLAQPHAGAVDVLLRPEELRVTAGDGAVVELIEYYGHDTVYVVQLDGGTVLRARAGSAPVHRRGDLVALQYAVPPAIAYAATASAPG